MSEGLVVVRSRDGGPLEPRVGSGADEIRVRAGETWPPCPTRAARSEAGTPASPHAVTARPTRSRSVAAAFTPGALPRAELDVSDRGAIGSHSAESSTPGARTRSAASNLAQQNDLFAAALAARRRGDLREAARWLDQLIDGYPTGPLALAARDQRQRLGAPDGPEK